MPTIEKRRNGQYRAKVRRYAISQSRTFKTRREAEGWATQLEGQALGGDAPVRPANTTTLEVAIEWFLDRVAPRDANQPQKRRGVTQHARNQVVHGNYWLGTIFAEVPLHAISRPIWRGGGAPPWTKIVAIMARSSGQMPSSAHRPRFIG